MEVEGKRKARLNALADVVDRGDETIPEDS